MQQKKINMNWVMFFSILTGIFAICTAISQSYKDRLDSEKRLADKKEIIQLQKGNNSKLEEINNLQRDIIVSNNKLIEANKRIESLNIEQLNYQSGGDSYGYVEIISILDKEGKEKYSLIIANEGKYPLYNVRVDYWNLADIKPSKRAKITDADGNFIAYRATLNDFDYRKSVDIGDISQYGNQTFGSLFELKDEEMVKINLHINSKNGSFSEMLRIMKKGNKLTLAYIVNTIAQGNTKSKILKEYADKDFPRTSDNKIRWE